MSASALTSTPPAWWPCCGVAGDANAALRSALKSPYSSSSAAAAPGAAALLAGASISDAGGGARPAGEAKAWLPTPKPAERGAGLPATGGAAAVDADGAISAVARRTASGEAAPSGDCGCCDDDARRSCACARMLPSSDLMPLDAAAAAFRSASMARERRREREAG